MPTYAGGTGGGSGRRLGVRIRTLREGLGAAVCLDVLPDGVGEGARLGGVWVEEEGMGGGDGEVSLGGGGGGGIGSDDLPASGCSPLSLFRSGPAAPAGGGGGGAVSRTCKGVADKTKFGDSCRISSIDPMSPPPLGAAALSFSFCPFSEFSPSVCVGAEEPTLLLSLLLSLSFDAPAPCCCCCDVDARVRNFTLRLCRLSSNMGRYCDCGLIPDAAFRLVFSRMVSRSCCMRRGGQSNHCDDWGRRGGEGAEQNARTYHFLASLPLGALDHATPMLPYDHEQDGKRHAAHSTAHNRRDGYGCTATARKRRQT
jgi:hypothetical protein